MPSSSRTSSGVRRTRPGVRAIETSKATAASRVSSTALIPNSVLSSRGVSRTPSDALRHQPSFLTPDSTTPLLTPPPPTPSPTPPRTPPVPDTVALPISLTPAQARAEEWAKAEMMKFNVCYNPNGELSDEEVLDECLLLSSFTFLLLYRRFYLRLLIHQLRSWQNGRRRSCTITSSLR